MMAAAALMVSPLPPYSSGISAARKPALVKRRDEFLRIGALAIERPPIFAGKIGAQRPHRLADRREVGAFGHGLTSARPLLMAMTSRSTTRARKLTTSPSRHISVRSVSPGNTGAEKRQANDDELRRIVAAKGFQHRVAGNAEIAEPVHDRPRIAGLLGEGRLGMQRIAVAAQPIDQRRFRPRREIADRVGRARRAADAAPAPAAAARRSRRRRGRTSSASRSRSARRSPCRSPCAR